MTLGESSSHLKVTALGGGHGLFATLRALRDTNSEITAVVTVADNGGSSGRLRAEFNSLPPGDLRMALAALCGDDEWGRSWAEIMQYRFTSEGEMNGHALGNLLLTALWDRDGDPVAGLDRVGELLKVVGRVLPMSLDPLTIEAKFTDGNVIRGQVEVGTYRGALEEIRIMSTNSDAGAPRATQEALDAIKDSDWITIGPGSWYSSVMPHLLLEEQLNSIIASDARKVIVLNLDDPYGDELSGTSPHHHLAVMQRFAPTLRFDIALADKSAERYGNALKSKVEEMGGRLVLADVTQKSDPHHHDWQKLASAFSHIFANESVR
ncbi:MAG: gluconeogenesis factor YvcK family protein [Candidatus Nanopelagicaceae bacterium]